MTIMGRWLLVIAGILMAGAAAGAAPQIPAKNNLPAKRAPAKSVSQTQVQKIMEFLKQTQPNVYRKALILRRSDPKKFHSLICAAAPNFRRLEFMQKYDPKLFTYTLRDLRLTHESYWIAWQLKKKHLDKKQAASLHGQLMVVVTEQFNLRQKIREHIIHHLLQRVAQIKAQLAQRNKARESIISDRIHALIGKQLSVNW